MENKNRKRELQIKTNLKRTENNALKIKNLENRVIELEKKLKETINGIA